MTRMLLSSHAYGPCSEAATPPACSCGSTKSSSRILLNYLAQEASGLRTWRLDQRHTLKSYVFGGMPASNAVKAAAIVRAGFTGAGDVLDPNNRNLLDAICPEPRPQALMTGWASASQSWKPILDAAEFIEIRLDQLCDPVEDFRTLRSGFCAPHPLLRGGPGRQDRPLDVRWGGSRIATDRHAMRRVGALDRIALSGRDASPSMTALKSIGRSGKRTFAAVEVFMKTSWVTGLASAAVEHDGRSGHEGAFIAGEVCRQACDLFRRPEAANRVTRDECLARGRASCDGAALQSG